jgi:hypothetical protein
MLNLFIVCYKQLINNIQYIINNKQKKNSF